jgi:protease-4
MASDVIWREVVLAKKSKPVIVSMANVAASGGYYIAAPATTIVAQPNTITGSIGVFGLLLNAEELLKSKMGVNIETVKTGKFADLGSIDRPLTTTERAIIQKGVDKIYLDFITKVAEGRKLSIQQVDSIAQGRVWAATDAKKIGLIDEFGGLDKAIEIAKTKTKISDCRIISFPEQKNPFESLLNSLSEQANTYFTNKNFSKEQIKVLKEIQRVQQYKGIQARMPYNLNIN